MPKLSFKEFLNLKKERFSNPEYDFAEDAARDFSLKDFGTWAELEAHLVAQNACFEAMKAGKSLHQKWKRYNR